eukprot:scaffold653_cov345-Pavlova_lutheri.AAC.6
MASARNHPRGLGLGRGVCSFPMAPPLSFSNLASTSYPYPQDTYTACDGVKDREIGSVRKREEEGESEGDGD